MISFTEMTPTEEIALDGYFDLKVPFRDLIGKIISIEESRKDSAYVVWLKTTTEVLVFKGNLDKNGKPGFHRLRIERSGQLLELWPHRQNDILYYVPQGFENNRPGFMQLKPRTRKTELRKAWRSAFPE